MPVQPSDAEGRGLLDRVVVPVASDEDATKTAGALARYADEVGSVVGIHVVEKAGGAPDKASVEQAQKHATEALEDLAAGLGGAGIDVETRRLFGTDIVDEIVAAAHDADATAIAFTPRDGGRLARLISGSHADRLVHESDLPVVALPDRETDEN